MTRSLTGRELEILRTWWQTRGSTKAAADLLGIKAQSFRNQMYAMRRMHGASSNLDLALRFQSEILA